MALATGAIALPVGSSTSIGTRSRRRTVVAAAAAAAVALLLCVLRLTGAGWFVVTTPSMGTAIPVGSLVVDLPVTPAALSVGDVITFVPPGPRQSPHTHRIVAIGRDGVRTQGDANGAADPWVLTEDRIQGRVVAALPGVGWAVRAVPLLLVGAVLTWAAFMLLRRPDHRAAAVLLGASSTLGAAFALLRPLVDVVLLTAAATPRGAVATVVSTGMLPVRVSTASGAHVDLVDGQLGTLRSVGAAGRVDLTVAPHLPPLGWAVLVVVCLLPLLVPFVGAALGRPR